VQGPVADHQLARLSTQPIARPASAPATGPATANVTRIPNSSAPSMTGRGAIKRGSASPVQVMRPPENLTQPDGMKIVNYAKYIDSAEAIAGLRPAHRQYMAQLLAEGQLVAGGPFTDGSGALFIYEASSLAAAEKIVAVDPYCVGGAFASYTLSPWEIIKANPTLIPAGQ
jgi:uncharacterized protein YciI